MTDHAHPVFAEIAYRTSKAYDIPLPTAPSPRPPEEVRQILASQPTNEFSAEAI